MNIFHEYLVLDKMEDILIENIQKVKLIGDIALSKNDFEYLAEKVKVYIEANAEYQLHTKYRTSVATFLVFCAVYNYGDGKYWPFVEQYTGSIDQKYRKELFQIFDKVLEQYGLPKFEKERDEGYNYVTPIVCHAGIPQNCFNDYFDLVSETLNNTLFFEGNILEEFKFLMRYKVQKPVIRYFEFLKDEAENFLQDSRDLLNYLESSDSSVEVASKKFSTLPARLIDRCFNWYNSDRTKEKIKTRKKIIISNPKIMLDEQGIGVYMALPQQVVKECFDDLLKWEIICDDHVLAVKARLFQKKEYLVSDEKNVPLLPANLYKVNLYLEDKLVGTWEFNGLADGYLAFDRNSNLVRRNWLTPGIVTIIFNQKQDLLSRNIIAEELPFLPKWVNYKIYRLNLEETNEINCSFGKIEVKSDSKPALLGGKTLFDQPEQNGVITSYTQLPEILFKSTNDEKWNIAIEQKHEKNTVQSVKDSILLNDSKFSLEGYIAPGAYGDYDINVWNLKGNQSRFLFRYVPEVEFYQEDSWPSCNHGYINNSFYCRHSKGVTLEFENAINCGVVLKKQRDYERYTFDNAGKSVYGTLSFTTNQRLYKIPVQKYIHPIVWGFMGIGQESSVVWETTPKTFSKGDLQKNTDVYLVLSVNDCQYDSVKLKLIVYAAGNRQLSTQTINAKKYSNYRIPLNNLLLDIQTSEESNCQLVLEVLNLKDNKISEFTLAKIQEDIICENLEVSFGENEDLLSFKWDEKGARTDRELVLYNCFMPWDEPKVFTLENGKCECFIDPDELLHSLYIPKIRLAENFMFFDEDLTIFKIPTKMVKIWAGKKEKSLSRLENVLALIFKFMFGYVEKIEVYKWQPDISKEDIKILSMGYLFFNKNKKLITDEAKLKEIKKQFRHFCRLYSDDKCLVLKTILEMELGAEYFISLVEEFNLLAITITEKTWFSPAEREKLWGYLPELAMIIEIQSKGNMHRVCNWVGDNIIQQIVAIQPKCTIRDCMERMINGQCHKCQPAFQLTSSVFGSADYIMGFFEYVSQEFYSSRRLEKVDNWQLVQKYESQCKNDELKILGKSYFIAVQEWKNSLSQEVNQTKKRKSIEETLRTILRESTCETYIKKNHSKIYGLLKLRICSEEYIGFYVGMIVFAGCLFRKGEITDNGWIAKGLTYLYKNCHSLFVRDWVIFALYSLFAGSNDVQNKCNVS